MSRDRQPLDRSSVERLVSGALRNCIHEHGPITPDLIGSASKRVVSQLRAAGLWVALGAPDEDAPSAKP